MQLSGKSLLLAAVLALAALPARASDPHRRHGHPTLPPAPQETGFLNRSITLNGTIYKFQVYLPEDYRHPDELPDHRHFPVILFLHGRGERGSEGMWQTQVGLPASRSCAGASRRRRDPQRPNGRLCPEAELP